MAVLVCFGWSRWGRKGCEPKRISNNKMPRAQMSAEETTRVRGVGGEGESLCVHVFGDSAVIVMLWCARMDVWVHVA